ncbi:hypothetical protein ACWN8V_12315 [Vagococcus elongatus]|uniref:hypothetical protein n=1 Tax=Vagococcus elongatus TaxID=180344 RepID=UPI000F89A457|nr:hypothetical protein [Vagococcus elongatus]
MIRLLTSILIIVLLFVAVMLNKYHQNISHVLGNGKTDEQICTAFKGFINWYFALSLLGLLFLYFNQKTATLIYLVLIMLVSAFYSLKISKNIHQS